MESYGRIYVATFVAVAATAAQDLFEINAPSDGAIIVHGWDIGQSTEFGDAQDENLRLELIRGYTTSGSGGSAFTALKLDAEDPAFGGTCEINNTTLATAGTAEVLHGSAFNVRAGHIWIPTPQMRAKLVASGRIVLRMNSTPTDSISFSGTLTFEEL